MKNSTNIFFFSSFPLRSLRLTMLFFFLLLAACGNIEQATPTPTVNANDPVAQGKLLYSQYCAGCHGANLEGEPNWQQPTEGGLFKSPPHDATGHTWHHGDQYLFNRTKFGTAGWPDLQGRSTMPAFETQLTDDEIWAILTYIKSTWPEDIQAQQAERTQQELNP